MSWRNEATAAWAKAAAWFGAWLGTVELADVQVVVAIWSGLAVGALAALNFWITYRDKVLRRRAQQERQEVDQ